MLTTVDFCGLEVTRLIIGANPFAGFSHQCKQRDREMMEYHTPDRIKETWARAVAAGINTMVTNNETPHVIATTKEYLSNGGQLQWITQLANRSNANMNDAVDKAVAIGAKAVFFHGGIIDRLYSERDEKTLRQWVEHAQGHGIPVGVAGHATQTHFWVDSLKLVDFHVVCFFNCGSLHGGEGDKFNLADLAPAVDCIRRIRKPCIGYKIMGAGRIDARIALEYAFAQIKPGDIVNVGMHRGDKDDMVEENVALVREILGC